MPEKSEEKAFEPVTFWLADPSRREFIYRPGHPVPLRFKNGRLTVETQADYDLVRRAMGSVVYEEDLTPKQKASVCRQCQYSPRSTAAFDAHQDVHPVQPR